MKKPAGWLKKQINRLVSIYGTTGCYKVNLLFWLHSRTRGQWAALCCRLYTDFVVITVNDLVNLLLPSNVLSSLLEYVYSTNSQSVLNLSKCISVLLEIEYLFCLYWKISSHRFHCKSYTLGAQLVLYALQCRQVLTSDPHSSSLWDSEKLTLPFLNMVVLPPLCPKFAE